MGQHYSYGYIVSSGSFPDRLSLVTETSATQYETTINQPF